MNDADLSQLGLHEASELIRSQDLSPVRYAQALLNRIAREDGRLHAFIGVTEDIALDGALAAEKEIKAGRWRGPLHGVPYALKDIIDYAGVRTTAQSALLADYIAAEDAWVVKKLKSQGAILLGKLGTDEFACGGHPVDCPWPAPRNPWNPEYITAGSSSGSAVAVAARMVPMSLGTDTNGSIRNPAARCGLVGMKPTYGRVSRNGVVPLAPTMDHVGPMTRTVQDNALALQAIMGSDPADPATWNRPDADITHYASGLKGLRIAVARNVYMEDPAADPEHIAGIEELARVLAEGGATLHEVRIPTLRKYNQLSRLLLSMEAYAIHEPWLRSDPGCYGTRCRERLLQGAFLTAADHARANELRRRYCAELSGLLSNADLLVTATGYDATPKVSDAEAFLKTYERQVRMPFNMTGHPALVVPTGFSSTTGMPLSAQIVGRHFEEATLYRAASFYERLRPWHRKCPPLQSA
ncbi:amidase [Parapusillimonas granuli]|uniref:Amidase n=1 Tax=Parapusillimonas granuli TaxID=380911 RepID=A0A853FUZ3_9BURK|nr:amidase [Parapusillimonas granuli]MBB5215548.1 aspartyl-tRNA(Asn)/glutamyl-tRNA(Gln) amidotransferase subunit A [Parapusillimonas granuli]NYT49785.1 amidase [Parapusillimonas granuli]